MKYNNINGFSYFILVILRFSVYKLQGIWYAISAERVRSFQALLGDLTRAMTDAVNLPHGVRHIFSMDGSQKINDLEEFTDGEGYVCSR